MAVNKRKAWYREYLKLKRKHGNTIGVPSLYRWAQQSTKKHFVIPWDYDGARAEFKYGGFDCVATIREDDSPDISWLGGWVDKPIRGETIRRNPSDVERDEYEYYLPGNTLSEARKWYRKNGYSKHVAYINARAQVLADMKRLADAGKTWSVVGVVVKVSLAGVELATGSLWGIDSPEFARDDCARDVLHTAIASARKNLDLLKHPRKAS